MTRVTAFSLNGDDFVVASFPVTRRPFPTLTSAEQEIVELAVRGLSNAEIADERDTACSTVANQLARIFEKLGVASRSELVRHALRRSDD